MRSSKGIRAVVCALVLGGVLALSFFMSWLLFPYLEMRHTVHVMEEPDYDTLIVGGSHSKCGIDPSVLKSEKGVLAINAAQGGEHTLDMYYLVREAEKDVQLKCVICEIDPSYWVDEPNQTQEYVALYHEFPWSTVKSDIFMIRCSGRISGRPHLSGICTDSRWLTFRSLSAKREAKNIAALESPVLQTRFKAIIRMDS